MTARACAATCSGTRRDGETLVHGLGQAFQKRGLPRAILMDNGAPMLAAETREGLLRLGVHQDTTLPYSPYQNAKQEVFWAHAEGRLLAMLEGVVALTLPLLNEATQAWVEMGIPPRPSRGDRGRRRCSAFSPGRPWAAHVPAWPLTSPNPCHPSSRRIVCPCRRQR